MGLPYVWIFAGLLLAYMVSAKWAGLDSRYPVAMGLGLLLASCVADAAGAHSTASQLAEFVIFLFLGGTVLVLGEYLVQAVASRPHRVLGPPS
jgi:hypothetical protein